MTPALDVLHARAAAVDGDDRHVLVLAGGLERLVGAGRGGLVDRVDEVDRRVLLEQVLHRRAPALLGAVGHVMADDPRVLLVADLGLVGDVDAEALEEALVALDVDRHAVRVEVEHRDLGLLAVLIERALGPLADRQAGGVVVGRVGDVGRVGRLGLRVQRDHQQAGLARLVQRGHDRLGVAGRDHQALRAGRDQALDGRDLRLVVAVLLAREGLHGGAERSWPRSSRPPSSSRRTGSCRSW